MEERYDRKVIFSDLIYSAFGEIAKNRAEDVEIHLVYAGFYYGPNQDEIKSFILRGMKMHKIKSVMVTFLSMMQNDFIDKREMEMYCKGEKNEKDSINDDLESLFQDLRVGNEPEKCLKTYFLPKLTEEKIQLLNRDDQIYYKTFYIPFRYSRLFTDDNADILKPLIYDPCDDYEYAEGLCSRVTITIENSTFLMD